MPECPNCHVEMDEHHIFWDARKDREIESFRCSLCGHTDTEV